MIHTIIVSGGNIQKDFALEFLKNEINKYERESLLLIAADRGLDFFLNVGILPDIAVGDFDSLSEEGRNYLEKEEHTIRTEIIRLKPEKDDSDTQSALMLAKERGCTSACILGATGSRLDHVMANFGLLLLAKKSGMNVSIVDKNNYITLLNKETFIEKDNQFGKYVSFFPLGGNVTKLTLEGFKYPLNEYDLQTSDSGLTVSNEIQDEVVRVSYSDGNLLMIMSRD